MQRHSLLLGGLLLGTIVLAQAPQQFNYQAVIRSASGEALTDQAVAFRISIRESSAGGAVAYQERHSTTTDARGLATLAIGSGTVLSGAMADVLWHATPHYLQVEVDTTGGSTYADLGAAQLLSVPYALFSAEGATVTDVTLEGTGHRGDTLRLARQGADSTDVLMWNGDTWIPVDIDILIGGSTAIGLHNTLDKAYDQGGPGSGRAIVASHGPVLVRNSGDNTALVVEDTLAAGTNAQGHVLLDYGGTAQALDVEHTRHGLGLLVKNDSTTSGTARNNVELFHAGNAAGGANDAHGRALLARTINRKNPRPTVEGNSLGTGHGVLGISGPNDWGLSALDYLPAAGVAGFSGTSDVGSSPSGSDGPFDVQGYRRGRVGVAGLSRQTFGVWGMTNVENSFSRQSPDSIVAGVVGMQSPFLGTLSGSLARFDHFGVAGLTPTDGSGVLGVGSGHGVVGWGGSTESATSAGVWGNTRFSSWPLTQAEYGLIQTGTNNKSKVGVLGTSADRTGVWGESKTSVGVAATAGGIFSHTLLELETDLALLAATPAGTAAKFLAAPDTATHTQLMQVKLAEKSGSAGYFQVKSDTVMEPIVRIDHESMGDALYIDADHFPANAYDADKGHAIRIEHRSDSSAALYIRTEGDANSIAIKSTVNDSAAILVNDTAAIGIRSVTQAGRAGIIGRSYSADSLSAGVVAHGASAADSAAALEIRDGAIRVTGASKPAGREGVGIPGSGGVVLSGITPFTDQDICCVSCGHNHTLGFYVDISIPNDLLDGERSHLFLTPIARPNIAGEVAGVTYNAVTAQTLGIFDGMAMTRVSVLLSLPCAGFNALFHGPEFVAVDYLIVNH